MTSTLTAAAAFHPSRVLVRFRAGASTHFLPFSGAHRGFSGHPDLHLVENPPGQSVDEVLRNYRADPNVVYAEPDYEVHATVTPNDPAFAAGQQWDMTQIAAPAAWDLQTDASDVVVAVVDTGIAFTHPDLQGNLYTDANGNHGYTCINGPCVPGGLDDHGHGTHVAGTIGAATNNAVGMAGINWRVSLLAMKFLDAAGSGNVSDAVTAFDQILSLKNAGVNIRVTNNSWSGGGYSQALKDAMTAVEDAGIVDVAAAGNSAQNMDVLPAYPAAYDNRGLISVAATDATDARAYFSNFGMASTDLSAPGMNTYSTVPTGACSLCDPSGYAVLSGTSMAAPHVTGVVAALLHRNPGLTASLARDVLLDPGSYDALTGPNAQLWTSTGGRLNFFKAITNPAQAPNTFPVLDAGPEQFATDGTAVTLSATATDADGDALRFGRYQAPDLWQQYLLSAGLNLAFPFTQSVTNSFTFSAPPLNRPATVHYPISVSDGRGGGATGMNVLTVPRTTSPAALPTGALSVSASSIPVGGTVTVSYPITAPAGASFWYIGLGGSQANPVGTGSVVDVTFNSAGAVRVWAQGIDSQLNVTRRESTVISVGGDTRIPPIAAATFDPVAGSLPLTVNIDMSASTDPDGMITTYFITCDTWVNSAATGQTSPKGSCTFTTPGPHQIFVEVLDNDQLTDAVWGFAMGTDDPSLPTVAFTSPTAGATISGVVPVAGTSAGAGTVLAVDVAADSASFAPATGTTAWTWSLDARALTGGAHTLTARATDGYAGATTATLNVTVQNAAPAVAITSPTSGASVSGTITVTGTASDDFGVSMVLVSVDDRPPVLANGTTSWSLAIDTTAWVPGTHTISAQAFDAAGQSATSSVTGIGGGGNSPPTLVLTFPKNGFKVPKGTTGLGVQGTASDPDGIAAVQSSLDGGPYTICQGTSSWICGVNVAVIPTGKHTLNIIAIDNRGAVSSPLAFTFSTR